MPEALLPDDLGATVADIVRRVTRLEASQRVGLSGARFSQQTAAVSPTTFGAYEAGVAGNTWLDDRGATGTGYPFISIDNMPAKALVMWGARPTDLANSASFRSRNAYFGVRMVGVDAFVVRNVDQVNVAPHAVPVLGAQVFVGFPRVTYTFQLVALWENTIPAAVNQPKLTDGFLMVIPLSA